MAILLPLSFCIFLRDVWKSPSDAEKERIAGWCFRNHQDYHVPNVKMQNQVGLRGVENSVQNVAIMV